MYSNFISSREFRMKKKLKDAERTRENNLSEFQVKVLLMGLEYLEILSRKSRARIEREEYLKDLAIENREINYDDTK